MFSDGVVELAEAGNITNQKKTLHRGQSVATFLMGTRRLYDYVDNNPAVAMYPVQYVNDPYVIAQNDNLVSINSCVEVDLQGQVCAEAIGLRQISGIGGQMDFVRGANLSKGGRSIIALHSTTADGKHSKIVANLTEGAPVTTSRCDVNCIVTEYGVAQLRGKTLREACTSSSSPSHTRSSARNLPRSTKSASVSSWKSRLPKRLLFNFIWTYIGRTIPHISGTGKFP